MQPRRLWIGALSLFAWCAPASAQSTDDTAGIYAVNEPAIASKQGKILRAFRLAGNPPRIDGRLDDDVWQRAERGGDYVQWEPDNMAPLSERTELQVAYDERFLYVAVRCYDRTPQQIASGLGRRDEFPQTDVIGVGFDPRHDHQTGYAYQTNPSSVQQDFYFFDDERVDQSYDAVWEVRVAVTDEGWMAEYRIPFSQMRFAAPPGGRTVWGFGSRRAIRRRAETGEWTGKPRGERGEVSRWGHLVFEEPPEPPRRIELLPYSLARGENLINGGTGGGAAAGLDARVGIGSAFTASATVNPDFGQVEQDPAVLNLTVFETFFPEKRPFFLEDSRTFVPPQHLFQLFHSRRIGRRPDRIALPSSDTVVDRPDQTTILGAAKLTGKTSGWTFGALSAATSSEHATVNAGERRLIEPLTSYNVARVQRDIRGGTSNVGALATATLRDGYADAYTGGLDYNLRWDRNRATVDGTWAVTRAPSSAGRIDTGFGGLMNFGFTRKHFSISSNFDHLSPTFRVNDIGFLRNRVNRSQAAGQVVVEQPDPGRVFRRIANAVSMTQSWNKDKLVFGRSVGDQVVMAFLSFWTVSATINRDFRVLDDVDTRGGPPIVRPAATYGFAQFTSDTRKSWRLNGGVNFRRDEEGGRSRALTAGITLQPSGRLQAAFAVRYDSGHDIAQWIVNRDVTGDGISDHVYGTLDRDVLDVTMRTTFSINRDLTFQLYLQPFVAAGDYTNIRRLAQPRSFLFETAALTTNPDFNNKSLRSNAVLRWEYLRGSTLYVVYNVATSDPSRPGTFAGFRDLGDAFGAAGNHVFMVKASYWFAR